MRLSLEGLVLWVASRVGDILRLRLGEKQGGDRVRKMGESLTRIRAMISGIRFDKLRPVAAAGSGSASKRCGFIS